MHGALDDMYGGSGWHGGALDGMIEVPDDMLEIAFTLFT